MSHYIRLEHADDDSPTPYANLLSAQRAADQVSKIRHEKVYVYDGDDPWPVYVARPQ